MPHARFHCLLIALAALLGAGWPSAAALAADADPRLEVFYVARRMSNINICGCRTKQRGGLANEALLYQRTPGAQLRLDAGGWALVELNRNPPRAMETRYLLRGLDMLGFDAVNFGYQAGQLSPRYMASVERQFPGSTEMLISANICHAGRPGERVWPAYRMVARDFGEAGSVRVMVTGVAVAPEDLLDRSPSSSVRGRERVELDEAYTVESPHDHLKMVLQETEGRADVRVLLLDADLVDAEDYARRYPDFDLIVHTQVPRRNPFVRNESEVLLAGVPDIMGKQIGHLALEPNGRGEWRLAGEADIALIPLEEQPDRELGELIAAFEAATATPADLPPVSRQRVYAGAFRCARCHREIYDDWRQQPHGHAMQPLIDLGEAFNSECYPCHTTAYREANGFYHVAQPTSRQMQDVQCEVCHGPSLKHADTYTKISAGAERWMKEDAYQKLLEEAETSMPTSEVDVNLCLTCHTVEPQVCRGPDYTGAFDFEAMMDLAGHRRALEAMAASEPTEKDNDPGEHKPAATHERTNPLTTR